MLKPQFEQTATIMCRNSNEVYMAVGSQSSKSPFQGYISVRNWTLFVNVFEGLWSLLQNANF